MGQPGETDAEADRVSCARALIVVRALTAAAVAEHPAAAPALLDLADRLCAAFGFLFAAPEDPGDVPAFPTAPAPGQVGR